MNKEETSTEVTSTVGMSIEVLNAEVDEVIVERGEYWNEEIVENYKEFLLSAGKKYPNLPKDKRRNFRKRAGDFVVQEGKLYYAKTKGSLRLALGSREEQQRAFQVRMLASNFHSCEKRVRKHRSCSTSVGMSC